MITTMNKQPNTADRCEIFVLMDNISDPFTQSHPGMRFNESQYRFAVRKKDTLCGADSCRACNGLSLMIRLYQGEQYKTILFDAGPDDGLVVENAQRMGLDLTEVDAVVISHGHYDHYGGIKSVLNAIGKDKLPVYVHPEVFLPRAFKKKNLVKVSYNITIDDINQNGGEVIEHTQPVSLFDGLALISGEVPRVTTYEAGTPSEHRLKNDQWVNSPNIVDERTLMFQLKNQGVCVFTACGHTGVVNAVKHAQELYQNEPIHMVMGGFHLAPGELKDRVAPTVNDLLEINPEYIITGHCTGRVAQTELTNQFADRHIPYSVGTYFNFAANS